ncbi:MAG: hypothetical protein IPH59_07945 [bacterium]|nr:hypothetical protein [bacterium]
MRRGIMLLICLGLFFGMFVMSGCEGDQGEPGKIGDPGDRGIPGTDPDLDRPQDRYFGVGVVNANDRAVSGNKRVFVTFDSTARATRDTVVAARAANPPLINGIDGEEVEWGEQKSRIRSSFLNTGVGLTDPEISEIVCRVAWDDYYIYSFFQWKERKVSVITQAGDSTIYEVTTSDGPNELVMDALSKIIEEIEPFDTTLFSWVRVPVLGVETLFCFFDPTVQETICEVDTTFGDTTLIWVDPSVGEDKLALFWGDTEVQEWSDLAFREFFGMSGAGGALPNGLFVDAWIWGAGTSNPVSTADDWNLTSRGKAPDAGAASYILNHVLPDSVPLYQSFRDPNYKSQLNLQREIYPLWYFDVVGFSPAGWDFERPVYLPGIISTIPSGSRADIYARATFDDSGGGVWTLEIRRARRTHSGDDVVF